MKKITFLFFILLSGSVLAQVSKTVTGPKAKNTKIWNKKKSHTILYINTYKKENLSSPEYKNQKIWERKKSKNKIVVQRDTRRRTLQGPKAKNFKPWKKH